MPRPPQPVLLPWLQPGGLEPPLRPLLCPIVNPDGKPPLKLAPPPWPPRSATTGSVFRRAWRARRTDQAGAAIDDEGLAGDVARLLRQQEPDGVADIPANPL